MRLRYEDLTAEPLGTAYSIYKFVYKDFYHVYPILIDIVVIFQRVALIKYIP